MGVGKMSNKNKVSVRIANVKCSDGKKLRKYFSKVLTKKDLGTRARIHIPIPVDKENPLVILKDSTTSTKGKKFVITTLDDCEIVTGKEIKSKSCEKNRSKISKAFDTVLHFDSIQYLKDFVDKNNIKKCAFNVTGLDNDINNGLEKLKSRLNPSTPSSDTPVEDVSVSVVGLSCKTDENLIHILEKKPAAVAFKETIKPDKEPPRDVYTILLGVDYNLFIQRGCRLMALSSGGQCDIEKTKFKELLKNNKITTYENSGALTDHVKKYVQDHTEK